MGWNGVLIPVFRESPMSLMDHDRSRTIYKGPILSAGRSSMYMNDVIDELWVY